MHDPLLDLIVLQFPLVSSGFWTDCGTNTQSLTVTTSRIAAGVLQCSRQRCARVCDDVARLTLRSGTWIIGAQVCLFQIERCPHQQINQSNETWGRKTASPPNLRENPPAADGWRRPARSSLPTAEMPLSSAPNLHIMVPVLWERVFPPPPRLFISCPSTCGRASLHSRTWLIIHLLTAVCSQTEEIRVKKSNTSLSSSDCAAKDAKIYPDTQQTPKVFLVTGLYSEGCYCVSWWSGRCEVSLRHEVRTV